MRTALLASFLLPLAACASEVPPAGPWRAWLDCAGGELPFGLELKGEGKAFILNGAEQIQVPSTFEAGRLRVMFHHYDSEIVAELSGGKRLDGTWRKRRGKDEWVEMPFHAERGEQPRFRSLDGRDDVTPSDRERGALAGRWAVQFEKDKHPAVGVFSLKSDDKATGTFLTTLGDYRYLAGNLKGGQLHLSCFDGAHAFLFKARLGLEAHEPTLAGDFWSSTSWHETWTARKDPGAALPDAFSLTRWTAAGPDALASLAFPDLEGRLRRLDEPAFSGKARILLVFGTWCPNCADATDYMVELDRRFRGAGLSILGLAFEHTGDLARDKAQVVTYRKHHGVEYPILVAGLSDKEKASQALPLLDRVRSYPTTIFLYGDGRVHAVHQGFSGPATGEDNKRLEERFEAIIEELLR